MRRINYGDNVVRDISEINKDIIKIEKLVSKCDAGSFPLAIISASDIEIMFSDKNIDWNTRNKLIGKLNSAAFHFQNNCSCTPK